MGLCERENKRARGQKPRAAEKIAPSKHQELPEKLKILLAALILLVSFSINFYWFTRSSLPAPINYNAVYDALHARD